MSKKIRAAVLFGGKTAEHEISLISAINIIAAMDRDRYAPVLIGVDKTGKWFLQNESNFCAKDPDPRTITLTDFSEPLALIPGSVEPRMTLLNSGKPLDQIEVIFPIIHGTLGEDGTLQGLLKHLDIPFVGPGVMSSALCMDKDFAKRILRDAGIPNAKFLVYAKYEKEIIDFALVNQELGMPVFIKPANMGSSVGISRAGNKEEFVKAVNLAFDFDMKIVIEEAVKGREIECAVLGNEFPEGSVPGEVIPKDGFYSYDAKYLDEKGAALEMPAKNLSEEKIAEIKTLAVKTYKALGCEGLARVDFFLKENGELLINEVNTLPGFTKISMYPKLWGLTGVNYGELIHQLIQLAISRHKAEKSLKTKMEF